MRNLSDSRCVQTVEDADLKKIKAFPTTQFFKGGTNEQYFPCQTGMISPPWDGTGLIGVHFGEIETALRAISPSAGTAIIPMLFFHLSCAIINSFCSGAPPPCIIQGGSGDAGGSTFPSWEELLDDQENRDMLHQFGTKWRSLTRA